MGRVDQIFRPDEVDALTGIAAIGHTRYSTTGSSRIENAQPILVESDGQALALGHNGNIVNPLELRRLVRERGVEPVTGSDSELLALLILHGQGTWEERIRRMMELASGAYSLDHPHQRRAFRGPRSARPAPACASAGETTIGWSPPRAARSIPSGRNWCAMCNRARSSGSTMPDSAPT